MSNNLIDKLLQQQDLPCLIFRDGSVIFPGETGVVDVDFEENIKVVEYAERHSGDKYILCLGKYDTDGWHHYGVIARVVHILTFDDERMKIMLQPLMRARLKKMCYSDEDLVWISRVALPEAEPLDKGLSLVLSKLWKSYTMVTMGKAISLEESFKAFHSIEDMVYRIAGHMRYSGKDDREILLNLPDVEDLVKKTIAVVEAEKEFYLVEDRLKDAVRKEMDRENREYAKEKKLRILQKELGYGKSEEVSIFAEKIQAFKLSSDNLKKLTTELDKLGHTSPASPEYAAIHHYLSWVVDLPWGTIKDTQPSIQKAKKILARDHFGLEKAKDRILESLAVQIRTGEVSGNILCLMGPPGVGKTSVGQSIADATGRAFVRIALGGIKDEAEIRGHRKTYVGAMPGRIIKALKLAGNMNPCILLDEIDKVGSDFRGDPSSALLEVLDPEQNKRFNDNFIDLDIDLSKVLFIATANSYNIPGPLLDRMEIIEFSGYTELEKITIAQKYLVPKSMAKHGLNKDELKFRKQALQAVVRLYTREAGVRELERMLNKVARKRVREILEDISYDVAIDKSNLAFYLGVEQYDEDMMLKKSMVGVAQGLAWTAVGGTLLNIEAAVFPGRGKLLNTGSLGDVMQESIQAAISVTRSIGAKYNLDEEYFENIDLHVHLPEGATPKDGPSAGITLCTALVSLFTNVPVRSDVAMTGEINLRGDVLAIGGLKEKLLAALQARVKSVIIPKENARDLVEMPKEVLDGLEIHPVADINQVLSIALSKTLSKSMWPKKAKNKKKD